MIGHMENTVTTFTVERLFADDENPTIMRRGLTQIEAETLIDLLLARWADIADDRELQAPFYYRVAEPIAAPVTCDCGCGSSQQHQEYSND